MRNDVALKKAIVPAIIVLIAAASYFQARGIAELVTSALGRGEAGAAPSWRCPPRSALAARDVEHATEALAILARNPFDSLTGPLLGAPAPPPRAPDAGDDPRCPWARVRLIAASDDPAWSFAAIDSGAAPGARGGAGPVAAALVRAGDAVAGYVVAAVGWDRVWLEADGARCQALLGDAPPAPPEVRAPATATTDPEKPGRTRGALPPELAAGIRQVGEGIYEVDRSTIAAILAQPRLLGPVRPAMASEGGRPAGVRLSGIRPGSGLALLGLQSGDRLVQVNGADVSDTRAMVQLYAGLQSASHVSATVNRGGQTIPLELRLR